MIAAVIGGPAVVVAMLALRVPEVAASAAARDR